MHNLPSIGSSRMKIIGIAVVDNISWWKWGLPMFGYVLQRDFSKENNSVFLTWVLLTYGIWSNAPSPPFSPFPNALKTEDQKINFAPVGEYQQQSGVGEATELQVNVEDSWPFLRPRIAVLSPTLKNSKKLFSWDQIKCETVIWILLTIEKVFYVT